MWENLVYEYTGLNFFQIQELNIVDFLYLRREAFINKMLGMEKGREYLDNAYRLEQTKPERDKLREKFGNPKK